MHVETPWSLLISQKILSKLAGGVRIVMRFLGNNFMNNIMSGVEIRRAEMITAVEGPLHVISLSLRKCRFCANRTSLPTLDMVKLRCDHYWHHNSSFRNLLMLQLREPSLMSRLSSCSLFSITSWLVGIIRLVCWRIHAKEECLFLLGSFHTGSKGVNRLFYMSCVLILGPLPILSNSLYVSSLLLEWFTRSPTCINCIGGFSVGNDWSSKWWISSMLKIKFFLNTSKFVFMLFINRCVMIIDFPLQVAHMTDIIRWNF